MRTEARQVHGDRGATPLRSVATPGTPPYEQHSLVGCWQASSQPASRDLRRPTVACKDPASPCGRPRLGFLDVGRLRTVRLGRRPRRPRIMNTALSRCLRLALVAGLVLLAGVLRPAPAHAAVCGLPDATWWIDF